MGEWVVTYPVTWYGPLSLFKHGLGGFSDFGPRLSDLVNLIVSTLHSTWDDERLKHARHPFMLKLTVRSSNGRASWMLDSVSLSDPSSFEIFAKVSLAAATAFPSKASTTPFHLLKS